MWKNIWPASSAEGPAPLEQRDAEVRVRHSEHNDAAKDTHAADSTLNRQGLTAHSNTQQRSILRKFFASNSEKKDLINTREDLLIGQAIYPRVAEKYMHSVEFDGIGRIISFKKQLSNTALDELQATVIKSLTQTNTADERSEARPGGDCLIQFMDLMQRSGGDRAQELLEKASKLWMSGNLSDTSVAAFLMDAASGLQDTSRLHSIVVSIADAVSKPKEATERNDNMYGRKFESEFVHILVKNPPAGTIEVTRKIGQALLNDFDKIHASGTLATETTLKKIADSIELRPWTAQAPDLERFKEDPTYSNLKSVLLSVNNGIDILKVQSLISKVSKQFSEDIEWKEYADQRYKYVLQPARKTRPFQILENEVGLGARQAVDLTNKLGLDIKTSRYGTGLLNHPEYETQEKFYTARDTTYGRMNPDMANLSGMEKQALHHGHAIVTGLSGNANLLTYLSRRIAEEDSEFSVEQAVLAGMMFLGFDGGHSLNEVMAVYTGVMASEKVELSSEEVARTKALEKRLLNGRAPLSVAKRFAHSNRSELLDQKRKKVFVQHLENYHLDYSSIVDLAKNTQHRDEISLALETALRRTIEYFNNSSYYKKQNSTLDN
ncbi:hypothetical protein [Herbaspirillum rubrisubalbicans]|uniref:hypothetical protein n=1 Tax=Herbaspirillum rubrisubalbicans TaxID=80842 RepID=UPI000A74FA75|nr:hypothetical protein [Herbaspirillum rubrisubalbicans]